MEFRVNLACAKQEELDRLWAEFTEAKRKLECALRHMYLEPIAEEAPASDN